MSSIGLYEYLNIAKKIIKKHGNRYMLRDEDAISYVASFIMKYDATYDETIGSREGYMYMNGRFGVLKWLKEHKNRHISLESMGKDGDSYFKNNVPSNDNVVGNVFFNEILAEIDLLTDRQKKCVNMYFFEHKTLDVISQSFGVTKERIRQIIATSLEQIRKKFDEQN